MGHFENMILVRIIALSSNDGGIEKTTFAQHEATRKEMVRLFSASNFDPYQQCHVLRRLIIKLLMHSFTLSYFISISKLAFLL